MTIELDVVTPRRLGVLLALRTQDDDVGCALRNQPFDQSGVEYTKVLSKKLEKELKTEE